MTQLEKYIYEHAVPHIEEWTPKMRDIQTKSKYLELPFICDGVIDALVYDVDAGMFSKIRYNRVKKNPDGDVFSDELSDTACLADLEDIETIYFEI